MTISPQCSINCVSIINTMSPLRCPSCTDNPSTVTVSPEGHSAVVPEPMKQQSSEAHVPGSGQTSHSSQQTIMIKRHHHHHQEEKEEDHSRSCVSRDRQQARVSLPEARIRHPEAGRRQQVRHSPWYGGHGLQWSLSWDGCCILMWWGYKRTY